MRARNLSMGSVITLILGIGLVVVAVATEILSASPDGIGPYQAVLISLGLLIALMGIFSPDHILSKITMLMTSFVVSVILIEGLLLLLNQANVIVTFPDTRELIEDNILGKRTPPDAVGHDARGWRNLNALGQANIVVIGDSQTWGVNATLEEAYPSVLNTLTGYEVYSMAQGSYGAVQYRVLAEQAIELSPQLVIVGMYFGNDFVDAYTLVYGDYAHQDLRDPSFDMTAITQTISEQAEALHPDGLGTVNQQAGQTKPTEQTMWERVQSGTYIGKFLTSVGVFDVVNTDAVEQHILINRDIVANSRDLFEFYSDNNIQTFLTPAYRQLVLDTSSPIIQEGIRISKLEYAAIQDLLSQQDVQFLVVLIPTKEYVYAPYFSDDEINEAYQLLITQETQIRNDMIDFFDDNAINYVDTLLPLREAADDGVAIYPPTFDGHPIATGYRIIAESIAEQIKADNLMK